MATARRARRRGRSGRRLKTHDEPIKQVLSQPHGEPIERRSDRGRARRSRRAPVVTVVRGVARRSRRAPVVAVVQRVARRSRRAPVVAVMQGVAPRPRRAPVVAVAQGDWGVSATLSKNIAPVIAIARGGDWAVFPPPQSSHGRLSRRRHVMVGRRAARRGRVRSGHLNRPVSITVGTRPPRSHHGRKQGSSHGQTSLE